MRMLHGILMPGTTSFDAERWAKDHLPEAHNDDALWGYCIRIQEELRLRDEDTFDDPILYRLFRMGIEDWTGENQRKDQSTQAMRFAVALGSRLWGQIQSTRTRVSSVQRNP